MNNRDLVKKKQIIGATLILIMELGLENTSMSLVSERAGVGMSSIYRLFDDKEGLINALYLEIVNQVVEAIETGLDMNAPIRSRFFKLWHNLARFYMEHPSEFLFLEQYTLSPSIDDATRRMGVEIWNSTRQLFIEAKEQEIIKDLRVQLLMHMAVAPVIALVKGHVSGQFPLNEDEIDAVVTACWDAIKR
ncbi:MAG: TetR family transcriptional regulator [Chloroflexota bacterium]